MFDWKTADFKDVEKQYSPSQFSKRPIDEYLIEYHEISSHVDASKLRVPNRPLLIYIHGGYWQRLSAADSLFNGVDALKEGISLHAVEYTLAPLATLAKIVSECIAEVNATIDQLSPTSVVLAGCSAGAHLTAMCMRDPRISSRVDAAVFLSGVYDIRPIVLTTINDPLSLTMSDAESLSPILLPSAPGIVSALCAVGENESSEFIRQNAEFAQYLNNQSTETDVIIVANRDHFDLPYDLLNRDTTVGEWTLNKLKGSEA